MLKYTGGPGTCQAPIDRVLSRLQGVRRSGKGWSALCPAHDDRHQSLSVSKGRDGRVLLKCHAGCDIKAIVRAIGLELRDLFPPKPERTSERTPTRVFEIRDVDGKLVALHERYDKPDGKSFVWKLPNGQTGLGGLSTKALPLYGSERLRQWPDDALVVLCEGEKAAQALLDAGIPALGTVCGASTVPDMSVLKPLAGRRVVLWPDNDDAGRAHMSKIAVLLRELGADVKWFDWPEAPSGGDAADYIAQGGDVHKLQELLASAPEWKPAPAVSYDELRATFEKWLALPDDLAIRFVLSVVIANRLSGDPLWAFIVGPSGSSKTELVNPLTTLEFVRPLDQLTTNTFLSGKQRKDPNASLLLQLPYGAILLIRDFSSILDMHREKRDEIFSQLRKIYDGHLARATGEGGESAYISWTGKVGVLACCTPAIERYRSLSTTLGERFIYFYMQTTDRLTIARTARVNRPALREMREELAQAVKRFFDGLSIPQSVEMPDDIGEWIARVADFVAVARTGVERDSYSASKEILESPDPEIPSRLAQQLDVLTCAHAVLMRRNRVEWGDIELTRHVALASIPTTRRRIIALFAKEAWRELTTAEVANALDLPTNTIRRHLEDLTALGLLKRRDGDTNAYVWWVADFCRDGWELLTGADTRGATQNASPDLHKSVAPQKSGYACVGVYPHKGDGVCLGGDFCGATPKEPSGCDNPVAPSVSEPPPDDEDCPF
jgi:DNA-binding transcriptional ArsR family regulator